MNSKRWSRWARVAVLAGSLGASSVAFAGGWLGVELQAVDPDLREALDLDEREGVLVAGVAEGSPADRAGIEEGDVIIGLDGQDVTSASRFVRRVRAADAGDTVELEVVKNGQRRMVSATLEDEDDHDVAPVPPVPPRPPRAISGRPFDDLHMFFERPRLGVTTKELGEDLASYFGSRPGEGVVVLEVMKDTPAANAGLKVGDVILRVDDRAIDSPAELREALLAEEGEEVTLQVRRHGEVMDVRATLESPRERWTSRTFRGSRGFGRADEGAGDREEMHDELEELRRELRELREEVRRLRRD